MTARPNKPRRPKRGIPTELKPEHVTVIIDTREQRPLDLSPLRTERATLTTGDYSIWGLEHIVSIERKSLPDLVACVGSERKRFERVIQRLLAYPVRAIVVEADWGDLEAGDWRGRVTPESVLGSVLGWIARGIPVIAARDRECAGRYVSRLLLITARHRWREGFQFLNTMF